MIQRGNYTLAEGHNMSRFQCSYDEDTILDAEKAREMLSVSYNGMQFYDHQKPRLTYSNYTGKLIVRQRMFKIIFLEFLANCHIKYDIS